MIQTPEQALRAAEPRPAPGDSRDVKKNYAERLSRHLATCFANALRPSFPGISPGGDGQDQESRARTSQGFKKLDVNYSTAELGLGLGVSIKTLNFPDGSSGRYTKNYSRIDNELRAEATDYHTRQPFAVLVAVLFIPVESCDDATRRRGERGVSSFGAAVQHFRHRIGRRSPKDYAELFERFFIGLYEINSDGRQPSIHCFDVGNAPPRARRPHPGECLSFSSMIEQIIATFDSRNNPRFEWAED